MRQASQGVNPEIQNGRQMSALVRIPDSSRTLRQFRKCATGGLMHRHKLDLYSITSVAVANSVDGTVRPSVLALFMFMTMSNLVGCSTGRSDGFAPLISRST